ncbi:hypothetical protein PVAP13_1KG100677 [Panicum virgatum]|uniref:Uncharacterized protein n=1 Tax=Panicum virgatum TaxID=38727 RepID=A0A8T0XMJ4_PANVG|nr:hypothetical protein PVAP13_1KG100677 [Panicum virgatum]
MLYYKAGKSVVSHDGTEAHHVQMRDIGSFRICFNRIENTCSSSKCLFCATRLEERKSTILIS